MVVPRTQKEPHTSGPSDFEYPQPEPKAMDQARISGV